MWRLLAINTLVVAVLGMAQSPAVPDRDWKRWLDDVTPLLTAAEKTEAKKTPAQARESFREAFWARRNPTGQTPDNPQRADFETRVREADRRFRNGGAWNDCGRTFVVLGKPDRVVSSLSAAHFAGGDRLSASREQDDVVAETWFYRTPARLPQSPQGYNFRFTTQCESLNGPGFQRLLEAAATTYVVQR